MIEEGDTFTITQYYAALYKHEAVQFLMEGPFPDVITAEAARDKHTSRSCGFCVVRVETEAKLTHIGDVV